MTRREDQLKEAQAAIDTLEAYKPVLELLKDTVPAARENLKQVEKLQKEAVAFHRALKNLP